MRKLIALSLVSLFFVFSSACKNRKDSEADSATKGFFQTEYIGDKFILHTKPLSEESIVEYIKRYRMADKPEDPKMLDKDLAKKILMISEAFGIDPYIVTVIIRKESEYQQSATGPGGSVGLMQILHPTVGEVNTQLGKGGPQNARATTIKYLQELLTDLYPKAVGQPFDGKPWTKNQMQILKQDPYQNIIYGALILKVYLSLERTKNKTGTVKDWYVKGLQMYNGSGKKVEYQQIVMNWADAFDKEYGGVASVSAKVAEEPGIIVDQAADGATFTGTWAEVKSDQAENGSYRHDQNSSKGSKVATFKITAKAGIYRTYARWIDHAGKGATNVPVEVRHVNGKTVAKVNQKENSGKWGILGTFTFDPTSTFAVLNSGTNGFVSADAFKMIEVDADPLIIVDSHDRDDKRIALTGTWDYKDDTEEVQQAYNKSIFLVDPKNGVSTATYKPNTKGKYRIAAHWLDGAENASNVKYIVNAVGGKKELTMNQKTGGGSWADLGIFDLDATSSVVITTEGADGIVIADAVRFDIAQ